MHYNKLIDLVGNTPILKWNDLFLKLETFNPSGSIKDRPASFMLERLIKNGIIKQGDTIICPTSGNMGISLAYFSKHFKLNVIIVMPDNMSLERRNIIKSLGANLILTPSASGISGSIKKAKELSTLYGYYYFDQFDNMLNAVSHFKTLQEIVKDIPDTDYIVCGIGTGGTYIGLKLMAKHLNLNTKIIGIEPSNSGLISKCINQEPILLDNNKNGVPGLNSDSISNIIVKNINEVDNIYLVNPQEVYDFFLENVKRGLFIGISAAANLLIANKIKKENPKKKIVVIIPDGIDRYYSDLSE